MKRSVWRHYSLLAVVAISLFVLAFRISKLHSREISWDAFGYYLYLPATFIHGDPLLEDTSWIYEANDAYELTGSVYQLSSNSDGEPMYFFQMGMAWFYLPFFAAAHAIVTTLGFPADGFSLPYQLALAVGCILYTIIGFLFLRKILLRFVSERNAAITLLLIFFGTNAIEHLTIKNLETINVLFMLCAMVVWYTIRWYDSGKNRYAFLIAVAGSLMALVKPSEATIVLIPLLWGISSISSLKTRFRFFWAKRQTLLVGAFIALLIVTPQLLYWYLKTGSPIFDSYVNPGVGLDFASPHVLDVLFSYRKGWFVYTPLMLLAVLGLVMLVKKAPGLALPIITYVCIELWVVSSWTEWWYGAAFSCRPMIVTYPLLAIALALLLKEAWHSRLWLRSAVVLFIGAAVFLNVFKWWQMYQGIVDPYRMTGVYYWATFLDTKWDPSKQNLLLVNRSFDGPSRLRHPEWYQSRALTTTAESRMINDEFVPVLHTPFADLSEQDHIWLIFHLQLQTDSLKGDEELYLVVTMEREEGSYGYQAFLISLESGEDDWTDQRFEFLTPELRSTEDVVHAYLWNRSLSSFGLRNVNIDLLERK